jgi:hypothetical protein
MSTDNIIDLTLVNVVDGLPVPKLILQEKVDQLKTMKLYPDDVWIVSYPKCGTTWMQQIVRLIRNDGMCEDRIIVEAVPWPEASTGAVAGDIDTPTDTFCGMADLENLLRPRTFKSHFPYDIFPLGHPNTTPCKYIYVARNPKDAAVSLYCKMQQAYFPSMEWDTYWADRNKHCYFGNYFDHVLSWWPHREDKNVLFMKYEDMKKDLPAAVAKVASFIDADISADTVARIADMTSFEKMKADKSANFSWDKAYDKDGEPTFLRKGIVGDWKNFFTTEQSAEADETFARRLKGTSLEFTFE